MAIFFWNITKSAHKLGFCPQTLFCDMLKLYLFAILKAFLKQISRHFWSKNSQSLRKSSPIIPISKIQVAVSVATEEAREV